MTFHIFTENYTLAYLEANAVICTSAIEKITILINFISTISFVIYCIFKFSLVLTVSKQL